MMIFDRLCGFVDNFKPAIYAYTRLHPGVVSDRWLSGDVAFRAIASAALFHFPDGSRPFIERGVIKEEQSVEEVSLVVDRFIPPFSQVIVEAGSTSGPSTTFLSFERTDSSNPGLINAGQIACVSAVDDRRIQIDSGLRRGTLSVQVLLISCDGPGILDPTAIRWRHNSVHSFLYDSLRREIYHHEVVPPSEGAHIQSAMQIPCYALRLLYLAMLPRHFIVKRSSLVAEPAIRGATPTSRQRPRYIVVDSQGVSRLLKEPSGDPDAKLKIGHRRRACYHRLQAERYRFKRGQLVPVKSCWVGPKEGIDGGERYEILVDLAACE